MSRVSGAVTSTDMSRVLYVHSKNRSDVCELYLQFV